MNIRKLNEEIESLLNEDEFNYESLINDLQLLHKHKNKRLGNKYNVKMLVDDDRYSNGVIKKAIIRANNDLEAFIKVILKFNTPCSDCFNPEFVDEQDYETLEIVEKIVYAINNEKSDKYNISLLTNLYNDMLDDAGYDRIISLISTDGNIVFQDPEFANSSNNDNNERTFASWFRKDLTGQVYDGSIDCSRARLTSLEGAPKEVKGDFNCQFNLLTSLKYSPEKVEGTFNCRGNKLHSLEGGPKYVGENFNCNMNILSNLVGSPEYVGEDFWASSNELTSIEGLPKHIGKDLDISYNKINNINKEIPQVKGEVINSKSSFNYIL
jgi:hypothetical protein